MDERFKALEPQVRQILTEKYERTMPANLFEETPPEREALKKSYRRIYSETIEEWDLQDETDEVKIAKLIAESISEMISEEVLNPCPEDWT